MDAFSEFVRSEFPAAVVAGFAFGLIHQAFRYAWLFAQLQRDTRANAREIERVEEESLERHEELVEILKPLPRIEAAVTQLMEDRKNRAARG